jgi:hypothetical protein
MTEFDIEYKCKFCNRGLTEDNVIKNFYDVNNEQLDFYETFCIDCYGVKN